MWCKPPIHRQEKPERTNKRTKRRTCSNFIPEACARPAFLAEGKTRPRACAARLVLIMCKSNCQYMHTGSICLVAVHATSAISPWGKIGTAKRYHLHAQGSCHTSDRRPAPNTICIQVLAVYFTPPAGIYAVRSQQSACPAVFPLPLQLTREVHNSRYTYDTPMIFIRTYVPTMYQM